MLFCHGLANSRSASFRHRCVPLSSHSCKVFCRDLQLLNISDFLQSNAISIFQLSTHPQIPRTCVSHIVILCYPYPPKTSVRLQGVQHLTPRIVVPLRHLPRLSLVHAICCSNKSCIHCIVTCESQPFVFFKSKKPQDAFGVWTSTIFKCSWLIWLGAV